MVSIIKDMDINVQRFGTTPTPDYKRSQYGGCNDSVEFWVNNSTSMDALVLMW